MRMVYQNSPEYNQIVREIVDLIIGGK